MFNQKEYYRKYYKKNKKKYAGYLKKYQNSERGKKKIKEYLKKYHKTDNYKISKKKSYDKKRQSPEFVVKERLRIYQFNVLSKCNNLDARKYIDKKAIIKHLMPFPECIRNYEIDHIVPLTNFDLSNDEEVKKAFVPGNHQWLQKWENQIKRSMSNEDFKKIMKDAKKQIKGVKLCYRGI